MVDDCEGVERGVCVPEGDLVGTDVPEGDFVGTDVPVPLLVGVTVADKVAVRDTVAVAEEEAEGAVQGQQPVPEALVAGRERRQVGGFVRELKLPLGQL